MGGKCCKNRDLSRRDNEPTPPHSPRGHHPHRRRRSRPWLQRHAATLSQQTQHDQTAPLPTTPNPFLRDPPPRLEAHVTPLPQRHPPSNASDQPPPLSPLAATLPPAPPHAVEEPTSDTEFMPVAPLPNEGFFNPKPDDPSPPVTRPQQQDQTPVPPIFSRLSLFRRSPHYPTKKSLPTPEKVYAEAKLSYERSLKRPQAALQVEPSPLCCHATLLSLCEPSETGSRWMLYLMEFTDNYTWLLGPDLEATAPDFGFNINEILPLPQQRSHQQHVSNLFNGVHTIEGHWDNFFVRMSEKTRVTTLTRPCTHEKIRVNFSITLDTARTEQALRDYKRRGRPLMWYFKAEITPLPLKEFIDAATLLQRHGTFKPPASGLAAVSAPVEPHERRKSVSFSTTASNLTA